MVARNKHVGSDFDKFLEEESIRDEVETVALKRVIAWQLQKEMKRLHISKTVMAKKMKTSRSAVDRLFDPENESMTLQTLNKAATALGKKLKVEFI